MQANSALSIAYKKRSEIEDKRGHPLNDWVHQGLSLVLYLLSLSLLVSCVPVITRTLWDEALTTHTFALNEDSPLELLWMKSVLTGRVVTKREFAALNGKIFHVGGLDQKDPGGLIVLDGESGDLLWELNGVSTFDVTPEVLFVENLSKVSAYNVSSGAEIWSTNLPGARAVVYLHSLNGLLYLETTGNYFYYLLNAASGEVLARSERADIFNLDPALVAALSNYPTITKTTIYFRAMMREVFSAVVAIDQESGDIIWRTETNVISIVAPTDSKAYVLTYDDQLQTFDARSGELIDSIQIEPSINFFDENIDPQGEGYHLAVDEEHQILYVLLGDSNQLFAFRIKSGR